MYNILISVAQGGISYFWSLLPFFGNRNLNGSKCKYSSYLLMLRAYIFFYGYFSYFTVYFADSFIASYFRFIF